MAVRALPNVETRVEVGFKNGAHHPAGQKAEELAAELDAIAAKHGVASVQAIKDEVLTSRESWPNIAAWLPQDDEAAWDIAIRERLEECCRSLVRYEVRISHKGEERLPAIRLYHSTSGGENGERGYLRLEVIARDEDRVLELFDQLQAEREHFEDKKKRVTAEIRILLAASKRQVN